MTTESRSRTFYRWFASLALAVAIGAGLWYYFWNEVAASYAYKTVTVDTGLIEQSVSATGSVQALITIDLSSQLSGQIAEVKVDFNSKVKEGDLLAVIDTNTFEARVKSAQANLEMALAGVQVQKATIQKTEALVRKAELDLARQQTLSQRGATSQTMLETSKTTLVTAQADRTVALAQLENANAQVAQRNSDLEAARIDLERTRIRSPIEGVVIARNIDPGGTVAASLSAPVLFQIAHDLSKIQIETQVDEADIGRIEKGNEVTFTVDAYPDQTFRGQVEQVRIGGSTENNVVTYAVIVRAGNSREKLLPGMTATVRIVTGRKENVLRVPNTAVRFRPPQGVPGAEATPRWGRSEAFLAELAELLKLTEDQQGQLRTALDELRARRIDARKIEQNNAKAREPGGNRRSRTQGRRTGRRGGRLFTILRDILTEEQAKIFQEWRRERQDTTRPAVVWLKQGEKLVPRRIRLGLADEAYSEIAGGILSEGDRVVTRVRTERKNARRR